MSDLWTTEAPAAWAAALARYDDVIARQDVARLPELDRWYGEELPGAIASRRQAHVTHGELVRVV